MNPVFVPAEHTSCVMRPQGPFALGPHMNLRFTVKHEKTEDENENEDEGCRLTPAPHRLPATDYWLLPTSEPGFALYVVAGWRIDSSG